MRGYKDKGIVLRRNGFGEADSVLIIYSENYGKLKLLAKGSRKIKSKFMGHLEPASLVSFSAVFGKSFDIISSVQIEKSFHKIKQEKENIAYISYFLEIIDIMSQEKNPNKNFFRVILAVLKSPLWQKNPNDLILFFTLYVLDSSGFAPEINNCVRCSRTDLDFSHFSYYWGGLVCSECMDKSHGQKISKKSIEEFRNLRSLMAEKSKKKIFVSSSSKKEITKILTNFISYINEKKPNSLKYMESDIKALKSLLK